MANTKRKARGLEWFNALFSRACFLERPSMNIIEDHGVYVVETMYQGKTLRSREATFDKARDALYDMINIRMEAMMPNITIKKKSTRGEASTTKSQERRYMEKISRYDCRRRSCAVCDESINTTISKDSSQ